MEKQKFNYEFMLVVSLKLDEEKKLETIQKFKKLIEANGQLESFDNWGKRRLAYVINKEPEGEYMLFNFVSAPDFPQELGRIAKITDGVLRSIIIKKVPKKKNKNRGMQATAETAEGNPETPIQV